MNGCLGSPGNPGHQIPDLDYRFCDVCLVGGRRTGRYQDSTGTHLTTVALAAPNRLGLRRCLARGAVLFTAVGTEAPEVPFGIRGGETARSIILVS